MEIQLPQLKQLSTEAKTFGKILLMLGGLTVMLLVLLLFKTGGKK